MNEAKLHAKFNRARLDDRQIDELIGLCHGIAADGAINQQEAEYLHKWLAANSSITNNSVIETLWRRVQVMLQDNALDAEESKELVETLSKFTGGDFELGEILKSTSLPLDTPPPCLVFQAQRFCFTGTFTFGSRKDCESVVIERGGAAGGLTTSTNYLVIGAYATDSWKHSSYGLKIEKAVEMKLQGSPISIVAEAHWARAIAA